MRACEGGNQFTVRYPLPPSLPPPLFDARSSSFRAYCVPAPWVHGFTAVTHKVLAAIELVFNSAHLPGSFDCWYQHSELRAIICKVREVLLRCVFSGIRANSACRRLTTGCESGVWERARSLKGHPAFGGVCRERRLQSCISPGRHLIGRWGEHVWARTPARQPFSHPRGPVRGGPRECRRYNDYFQGRSFTRPRSVQDDGALGRIPQG